MKIARRSPFSRRVNEMELDVTQAQIDDWNNGTLIQDAMPNLSDEQREFLMTGITPEEWRKYIDFKRSEGAVDTALPVPYFGQWSHGEERS